jgi:hypothetical protein
MDALKYKSISLSFDVKLASAIQLLALALVLEKETYFFRLSKTSELFNSLQKGADLS